MKYLPKDSVATLLKSFLYLNKPVYLDANTELKDWVFKNNYNSIPLSMLVDLRLINFAMKMDIKILFTLHRSMSKLFETTRKAAVIPDEPDAPIQFHDQLYISYQETSLTKTFDVYLSGILRSETALKMGILPAPYQQLFEINKGTQSLTVTL